MSAKTKIEWADTTWNPVVGCSQISLGCKNCYAKRMIGRFPNLTGWDFDPDYQGPHGGEEGDPVGWDNRAHFMMHKLDQPLRWRKPRKVFVCSMGDLFHETITNEQIAAVFGVMASCPQHTFMILTKRPDRMMEWYDSTPGDLIAESIAFSEIEPMREWIENRGYHRVFRIDHIHPYIPPSLPWYTRAVAWIKERFLYDSHNDGKAPNRKDYLGGTHG